MLFFSLSSEYFILQASNIRYICDSKCCQFIWNNSKTPKIGLLWTLLFCFKFHWNYSKTAFVTIAEKKRHPHSHYTFVASKHIFTYSFQNYVRSHRPNWSEFVMLMFITIHLNCLDFILWLLDNCLNQIETFCFSWASIF